MITGRKELRTKRIVILLTEKEKKILEDKAKKNSRTLTDYIRVAALQSK
ncbi:MAG: hypothetical protein LBT79_08010 [Elusimicrobiota bacterium]|jgi:uncharacterized protein (DUF1778 family)|nr:hypothetical protein [Elusimicrobiota bacterium]